MVYSRTVRLCGKKWIIHRSFSIKNLRIDAHTHILPRSIPDFSKQFGYDGFITLQRSENERTKMILNGKLFREVDSNCFDDDQRHQDMLRDEIAVQVVCTVPVMFNYWAKENDCYETSKFLNDDLAEIVKKNSPKYIGLGTIPMNAPNLAVRELERCIKDLGFAGIQIGSHVNDKSLADPSLFPIFQLACELNAAVLIHPWDMAGRELMNRYWLPWLVGMPAECSFAACSLIFGGVMRKLPKLRVCLSHGGGSFPWTIGRIEHGFKVRPDLVAVDNDENPREYLSKFYYDGHVCDPYALRELIQLVGVNRVMLGSDYPFPLGERPVGSLIDSLDDLDSASKEQLFAGTALEWLGRT